MAQTYEPQSVYRALYAAVACRNARNTFFLHTIWSVQHSRSSLRLRIDRLSGYRIPECLYGHDWMRAVHRDRQSADNPSSHADSPVLNQPSVYFFRCQADSHFAVLFDYAVLRQAAQEIIAVSQRRFSPSADVVCDRRRATAPYDRLSVRQSDSGTEWLYWQNDI